MLEIIGTLEESFNDFIKRDKYHKLLGQYSAKLHELAYNNAAKAMDIVKQEGFDLANLRQWVSQYCQIIYEERNDTMAFSSIHFPSCAITIYLKRIEEAMSGLDIVNCSKERFIDLFILHEFYHYLEFKKADLFEGFRIPIIQFNKFKILRNIGALSEMSATAFMRLTVLDVPRYLEGGFHDER